jgi:alpha-1,2-mannosyltransferase
MSLASSSSAPRASSALWRALGAAEWATPARLKGYLTVLALAHAIGLAVLLALARSGVDPRGEPLGTDFVSFWTAGKLAIAHRAAAVYTQPLDLAAERAFFGHPIDWYAFFYPPVFLLVCAPLGLMAYLPALAVWLTATFAAFAAALKRLSRRFVTPLTLAAFPGSLAVIGHGQNAFLSTALFSAGASLLEQRPALAGALFGALCFKPQLAIVIPLGLVVAGRWRALSAFLASAAALTAVSVLFFGVSAWAAFLAETPLARATLDRSLVDPAKMQSVYAAVRVMGGGSALGYVAQGLAALAALAALVVAIRRESQARLQFALVAAVTCLTTPFLLDYDLTLLAAPILILAEEGAATGFRPFEKAALAAAFVLPDFARPLAQYAHLPLSPLVVAALAAVLARRMIGRCRPAGVPA